MTYSANDFRLAAEKLRHGDVYSEYDRGRYPRMLTEAYDTIAALCDSVQTLSTETEALRERVKKLENPRVEETPRRDNKTS